MQPDASRSGGPWQSGPDRGRPWPSGPDRGRPWPGGPRYGPRQRRGTPDLHLRVGDAERNELAETLSQHYSDGRLDASELRERLDRAMAAKTRGDLAGLLDDLPPLAPTSPPAPAASPRRRRVGTWAALFLLFVILWMPWHLVQWMWLPPAPWLLVALVALFAWRRSRHRRSGVAPPA